jgi:hypothetical protein
VILASIFAIASTKSGIDDLLLGALDDATVVTRHTAGTSASEEPHMPSAPLTRRVQILEEKVGSLERLPARIDAIELQILQFREEVRAAFSATRDELQQLDAKAVSRDEETRRFMRMLHEHVVGLIATMDEGGRRRE